MPLLDHFHGRLAERRPWESFHTTWASALADQLNDGVLSSEYVALEQVHAGPAVEIDVATFAETSPERAKGGLATAVKKLWRPVAAPHVLSAEFPPQCSVEIIAADGSRRLVAAIELVSPGNKDRDSKRRLFAAKCATLLSRGAGLVIVDVVASRSANLHNDLADLFGWDAAARFAKETVMYCSAYRPLTVGETGRIEAWLETLSLGNCLPRMPLSLAADCVVPIDLEAAYEEACRRRRVADVLGR